MSNSKDLFIEAKKVIPGGVNSPVRAFASVNTNPIFVKEAYDCYVKDEDDNEYIDYIGSWGPMILGHNQKMLHDALVNASLKGMSYGLPTKIEIKLANQIINAYPGLEMVRMVNSGTEATMSAIRVARGYTNRDKIIKFEGNYHGHNDSLLVSSGSGTLTFNVPTSPGVPQDIIKNTLVCRYNDIDSVEKTIAENKDQIACIIIEPIAGNMGLIAGEKDFLLKLRKLCSLNKIVLIFDEVISGFRAAFGGAAQYYGIEPDMACFGKIIGGGLPVGAYGGKKEIMTMVSPSGPIYQAGTLSGNPLAMHVGSTLLNHLQDHQEIYDQLEEKGKKLEMGMKQILSELDLHFTINRVGSLLTIFFANNEMKNYDDVKKCDTALYAKYFNKMLEQKILIAPSQFEAMFISCSHTDEVLEKTLKAFRKAMEYIKDDSKA